MALFAKFWHKLYNFAQMSERPSFPQIVDKEKARVGFEKEFDVIVGGEALNFRFRFFLLENENGVLMEGEYVWWGSLGSRIDDREASIMAAARGDDALRLAMIHACELYPGSDLDIQPKVLNIAGKYTAWDLREDFQKLQSEFPHSSSQSA